MSRNRDSKGQEGATVMAKIIEVWDVISGKKFLIALRRIDKASEKIITNGGKNGKAPGKITIAKT